MDIVEALYKEIIDLDNFLQSSNEISLKVAADSQLRKSLLLASASFYEKEIIELIETFAKYSSNNEKLFTFIQKKALLRQYHTLFSWDTNNCNTFLSFFGEDYKQCFTTKVKGDEQLNRSIKNFLEIGRERNRMVHLNFGNFMLEKTAAEIMDLHKGAKLFVNELRKSLLN